MSDSMAELNAKIVKYKKVRMEVAAQKGILDVMEMEKQNLSDEIMEMLKTAGVKSYKNDKLGTLSLVQKPKVVILDPTKVAFWLKMQEYDTADYMRLDTIKVRPILENAAIANGEIIEGAEVQTSEYLSLRFKKEATA